MLARRTISELLARYRFEPSVKDVFVEGRLDEQLIATVLETVPRQTTQILRIEHIDVPNTVLQPHELGSAKGRLQGLAREIESKLGPTPSVCCVIDEDYDRVLGNNIQPDSALIRRIDYSSSEMYLYDVDLLEEYIDRFAQSDLPRGADLLEQVGEVLVDASSFFAANQSLNLKCGHIELAGLCEYSSSLGFRFQRDEYAERYLNKGSAILRMSEFREESHRILDSAPEDPRLWVRGRDFLPLVGHALRASGVEHKHCTPDALQKALVLAADADYLLKFQFFQDLVQETR